MPLPEGEFLLPIFPLPDLVFFPQTRVPLHVFEPRYRQMVADAMASDGRIGMVLLRPGWETDYYGAPPVHEIGTLGVIEQAVPLDDGRYNLLLRGDVRFRIVERVSDTPYRLVRAVAVPQTTPEPMDAYAQREILAELARQYLTYLPNQSPVPELSTAGLESLCNALVMSLNIDAERKQELLEMTDVARRAEAVGDDLKVRIEGLQFLAPFKRPADPSAN